MGTCCEGFGKHWTVFSSASVSSDLKALYKSVIMPPPRGHNAVIGVRRPALIFCLPSVRPCGNHAKRKRCTNEKTIQCLNQTPRSMYPSIFNSFSVIRTASAKNRRFHFPQPTVLFPLETPLRLSLNMLHGWKDNSMLAKLLAACTYLSTIFSELYDA